MATPHSFDPDLLASHVGFVRRLARGLVRGADEAEDVAAEALAAAVAQRPETGASFRGWLRRVVARLARRRLLADEHRRAREQLAASPDYMGRDAALRGADEVAAQIELEREVALAFAALEEPYRTTLFRRYWHDLTPTQIAAETATPLATVKSRLQRGLEQLRERLDATHRGGREEWMGALVRWSTIGGTVMAAKSKLLPAAIAALVLLGASVALFESSRRVRYGGLTATPPPASAAAEAARAPANGSASAAAAPAIVAMRAPDPSGLPFAAGIVVDAAGRAIEGVRVLATRLLRVGAVTGPASAALPSLYEWPQEFDASSLDAATVARSGADGRFAVPPPRDAVGSLRFAREGFGLASVHDFDADPARNQELRVTLAPERRVRGTVRESDGHGLDLASIWVLDAEGAKSHRTRNLVARHLPGAPEFMGAPELLLHKAKCDAEGRFDLRCVPDRPFEVIARAQGYSAAQVAAAELPDPWEPTLVRSDLLIDVVDAATGALITDAGAIVVARGSGVVQEVARSVVEQVEQPDRAGFSSRPVGRLSVMVQYPLGGLTWLLVAPDQTVDATIHVAAIGYQSATVDTPITAKVEPPRLRVELVPDEDGRGAPSITGVVVGPPDAEVALYAVPTAVHGIDDTDWLSGTPQLVAKCAEDGGFAFPELPPARYLLLARSKENASVRADVTAPCRDVVIELAKPVTLEVAVVASDGAPIPGAIVQAQDAAGRAAWIRPADAHGIARFEKLPAGTLRALAVAPEASSSRFASASNAAKPLDAALFALDESIDARGSSDGASVRLVVHPVERRPVRILALHDDGSPAPDAKYEYAGASHGIADLVRSEPERMRRFAERLNDDARGETTLELYPGEHWFIADEGRGRESEKIVVPRAGDASVTFRLPDLRPTGTLRGRVKELGSGAPIAGRDVEAFSVRRKGETSSRVGMQTTDADGGFEFAEVPRGEVVLWIHAQCQGRKDGREIPDPDSPYPYAEHRLHLEAGRESTVEIELPPLKSKSATLPTLPLDARVVEGATGAPIEGATIDVNVVRGDTQLSVASLLTGADGRVHADVFAAETYRVYVMSKPDPKTMKYPFQMVTLDLTPQDGTLTVSAELASRE